MPDKEKEEESSGFKVVDRRLFTPEGERRTDAAPETPKSENTGPEATATAERPQRETPPPEQPSTEAQPKPEDRGHAHAEPHGPASFEQLVMSLATTTMFQLGLVKSHEEETPRVDLDGAKETIDLLNMLQQKTEGNLTQEEQALLEGSLYELRMVFVELSKAERGR